MRHRQGMALLFASFPWKSRTVIAVLLMARLETARSDGSTAILVHGCHLQASGACRKGMRGPAGIGPAGIGHRGLNVHGAGWESIAWGDESRQQLGRVPQVRLVVPIELMPNARSVHTRVEDMSLRYDEHMSRLSCWRSAKTQTSSCLAPGAVALRTVCSRGNTLST